MTVVVSSFTASARLAGSAVALAIALTSVAASWACPASAQPALLMDDEGTDPRPWINGYVMAGISDAAYLDDGFTRRNYLASLGVTELELYSVDTEEDTQVLFAETRSALIVAVRGTQEGEDWWTDIQIGQYQVDWYDFGDVQVHNGFDKSADEVFARVRSRVESAYLSGKSVFFTGHSLGGAVAQILALRCSLLGFHANGVITFGSPRVGNDDWKALYEWMLGVVTHRFINEGDTVPCHPLIERRWESAGPAHHFSSAGLTWSPGAPPCNDSDDHGIANYVAKFRRFMPGNFVSAMRRPIAITTIATGGAAIGDVSGEVFRSNNWSEGWSDVLFYGINGASFVALYKNELGNLRFYRINADGSLGSFIEEHNVGPNAAFGFNGIGGSNFFIYTPGNARITRYPMRLDGSLCNDAGCGAAKTIDLTQHFGWIPLVLPYTQLDVQSNVLVISSRYNGHTAVFEAGWDFGALRYAANHGRAFTATRTYMAGGVRYLFQLAEEDGIVHIRRVNADLTVGPVVHSYDWTRGWTAARFFQIGGVRHLVMLKAGTGDLKVFTVNDNGSIGALLDHRLWSVGWQGMDVITAGGKPFLLTIKK